MSPKRLTFLAILPLIILAGQINKAFGQVSISGPSCVVAGTTSLYTFSGSYTNSTTMTWGVSSNATIQQAYGSNVTNSGTTASGTAVYQIAVLWNAGGNGAVTLSSSNGNASPLSVTIINALAPGSITAGASQSIAYNVAPASISCSAAAYGACSPAYTYQWQKSTDNSNFTDISGQTGQNISFTAPIIVTTYYRRKVTETSTNTTGYSNTATVTVGAPFSTTAISPATQNIFTGAVPTAMSGAAATGGSCSGNYTYQWQQSTDGGNTFTDISGATGLSYTPAALTVTTYYRRKDVCSAQLSYNNTCVVNVYQHVNAGTLSPSALTITYGTVPGSITPTNPTGGMCSPNYAYQWQQSADNVTFTDIAGATGYYYGTGPLTATTYLRRKVTCSSETAYTNTSAITVNPKVFPGAIFLNSLSIATNTSPGAITANAATGGACNGSFSYQWQQSTDGMNYTDISGATGLSYTPGNLTVTTYYRRKVTCTIDVLYTNVCTVTVSSASPVYNYVQTRVITKAGVTDETTAAGLTNPTDVRQSTQYFDGLGRLVQTVNKQASPATNDMVVPNAYNEFGREIIKFLPYATTTTNGTYKATAIPDQAAFYNPSGSSGTQLSNGIARITTPYAITGFDSSPLGQVLEQGAPGDTWQLPGAGDANSTGHTVRTAYTTNDQTSTFVAATLTNNPGSKIVALYTATVNADLTRSLSRTSNATYLPGMLDVTIIRDENWQPTDGCVGTTEEYKDLEGHVVLKRTYNLKNSAVEMLSTYYVYDNMGNLCFVLPPGAGADAASSISQTTLDNLCYQYYYDSRNRLNQKKIPGKGWEYIAYNKIDQPVLTQDANQRLTNQWTVTKYDALGRVIMTGLWNAGSVYSLTTLQTNIYAAAQWDTRNYADNVTGYTISSYPAISAILSINYYDDYVNIPGIPSTAVAPTGVSQMTKGELTVGKTAVLNTINNATPDMLWSAHYYDDLGRITQSYAQHYLGGTVNINNYDVISNTYDFTNVLTASTRKHYTSANTSSPAVTIANTYTYDHMGRKKETYESINGATSQLLSHLDYNEIGQLYKKNLHGINGGQTGTVDITLGSADALNSGQSRTVTATNSITLQPGFTAASGSVFNANIAAYFQTITYTYNERGWLTQNTAPLFAMQLKYSDGSTPQYNGNIANQLWGTPGNLGKTYTYSYDRLNRLTSGTSTDNYNETGIVYDQMGNITALQRYWNNTLIDNLTYTYNNTNQLQSINDVSADASSVGYKSGNYAYAYDANGNMITDNSKVISITYNLMNLPQSIAAKNTTYTYDANGQKLRKVIGTTATDYISGIQYDAGVITFIQTDEGRALPNGSSYNYEYNLSDQLGNVRVTFDSATGTARQEQQDDYLPFGMEISRGTAGSPKNEYLYNKKELQENLQVYDYGARFYDPVIARWNVVDPNVESGQETATPYGYVWDDPIKYTDPDGRAPDITIEGENNSSVTIQTNLINTTVHVGIDLHGNHTINGERALQTGLDLVSLVDPTGLSSLGSAGISAKNGEWLDAGISLFGALPLVGKLADGVKVEKDIKLLTDAVKDVKAEEKSLKIEIADADKIDRELLNPPDKHGNAPTFKSDGEKVDIHHVGQNAEGPFQERHPSNHRKNGSWKENHVSGKKGLTKSERKAFDKAKTEYWKKEYPKQD